MSQPALSLAIRTLEDSLGGRLFVRTTRHVQLTPEGSALLPQAIRLLADWDSMRERSRQHFTLQRGHVTIAAMPSFAGNVLPRILVRYRARFPNVTLSVHDVVHEQVIDMVRAGRVEIGFAFEPDADQDLAFRPLFADKFVAVIPADGRLGRVKEVVWAELLEEPFIALQRPSTVRRFLEASLEDKGLKLHVALECHQLATVGQFVAAGLGVSVVPALCSAQMRSLGAACVPVRRPAISRRVGFITRRDQQLSTAAAAMTEVARESGRELSPRA